MMIAARFAILLCMLCALTLAACERGSASENSATPVADANGRCPHEIKFEKCPFCTPSLVETEGFCGEHGVAEALCAQCRPYLKAAFRAKGDWCDKHSVPDSQCHICHPDLKANVRPGEHGVFMSNAPADITASAATCEHGIAAAQCPFCTPSLIESEGFCDGHNVAEALCVKCRPYLKAAFIAKGDWCAAHDTPESQCAVCNPDLAATHVEGNG